MIEHPDATRLDALAAGDEDTEASQHVATCTACAEYVAELSGAARTFANTAQAPQAFVQSLRQSRRGPQWRFALVVIPVLAAAAMLVVFMRAERFEADTAHSVATRFKGALQLAVVRERSGRQERFNGKVTVKPRDALVVELAVAEAQELSAAFLGSDGSFVLLLSPRRLSGGTHHSERAARFDDRPTSGTVIAGSPEAVERARRTRSFADVAVLSVDVAP
jgi:hypothetical protein